MLFMVPKLKNWCHAAYPSHSISDYYRLSSEHLFPMVSIINNMYSIIDIILYFIHSITSLWMTATTRPFGGGCHQTVAAGNVDGATVWLKRLISIHFILYTVQNLSIYF